MKSILVLLFFSLSSCESVSDCILGIKPELVEKTFPNGNTFQHYHESIAFNMKHANTKDYFINEVSIEGKLPPGVNYSIDDLSTIILNGNPNTSGTYDFKFKITVRPYIYNEDGSDNLCGNVAENDYRITID